MDSAASCALADFVCHIAAQLATSPLLVGYGEWLTAHTAAMQQLHLSSCLQQDVVAVWRECVCEPLALLRPAQPMIVLIDAIDVSDFHAPESTDSLSSFLNKYTALLPSWLRLVVGVRTDAVERHLTAVSSRRLSLDDVHVDERVWRDCHSYVQWRVHSSPGRLRECLSAINRSSTPGDDEPIHHFATHLVSVSGGSMLYIRLTLDLIECGALHLKSQSYSALPVSLAEVYMLMFNLRHTTLSTYERVSSIYAVLIASVRPLTLHTVWSICNASRSDEPMDWTEFVDRYTHIRDMLVDNGDNGVTIVYPSLRDWLTRRQDGTSTKFLADIRLANVFTNCLCHWMNCSTGHLLIALWMSRRADPLSTDELFELGHHLLKAHPFRHVRSSGRDTPNQTAVDAPMSASLMTSTFSGMSIVATVPPPTTATGRDCQLHWIQQAAGALLPTALCSQRNLAAPNTKVCTKYVYIAMYVQVSRLLLLAGADAQASIATTTGGVQPLLCAASARGAADLCSLLIEFAPDAIDRRDSVNGRTPLMFAARSGHLDVVQILHQHSADVRECAVHAHAHPHPISVDVARCRRLHSATTRRRRRSHECGVVPVTVCMAE
jgi:hypothetical protein